MNIDEPSTAATPFDTLGGESQVLALAERFYDLMNWSRPMRRYVLRTAARWHRPGKSCSGICAVGSAGPSTTPSALATPGCAPATCRL